MGTDFEEFRRAVEGAECLGLLAEEFYFRGELVTPANAVWVQFAPGRWLFFLIDAGAFVWREAPLPLVEIWDAEAGPELQHRLVSVPLRGAVGSSVVAAELAVVDEVGARLELRFASGARLALRNDAADETALELSPPVA
jgi:hypothetical protein